jgi:hypothetical protein
MTDPEVGGCWICHDDEGGMVFSIEFDAWYHPSCLPDECNNLVDYEKQREPEHEVQW